MRRYYLEISLPSSEVFVALLERILDGTQDRAVIRGLRSLDAPEAREAPREPRHEAAPEPPPPLLTPERPVVDEPPGEETSPDAEDVRPEDWVIAKTTVEDIAEAPALDEPSADVDHIEASTDPVPARPEPVAPMQPTFELPVPRPMPAPQPWLTRQLLTIIGAIDSNQWYTESDIHSLARGVGLDPKRAVDDLITLRALRFEAGRYQLTPEYANRHSLVRILREQDAARRMEWQPPSEAEEVKEPSPINGRATDGAQPEEPPSKLNYVLSRLTEGQIISEPALLALFLKAKYKYPKSTLKDYLDYGRIRRHDKNQYVVVSTNPSPSQPWRRVCKTLGYGVPHPLSDFESVMNAEGFLSTPVRINQLLNEEKIQITDTGTVILLPIKYD